MTDSESLEDGGVVSIDIVPTVPRGLAQHLNLEHLNLEQVKSLWSSFEDIAAWSERTANDIAEAFAKLAEANDEWRAKNEVPQRVLDAAWSVSARDEPRRIGQHTAWLATLNCNERKN